MQEQGQKQGRGIGFQLNAITLIGVVVMVTILVSFVGYRAYDELLDTGTRAQFNELEGRSTAVISRYESVQKIAEERQISEADHRQLARALALTNLRLKLLQSRNPFWALGLMFQIREYRTIKDFISDLVYTYSLNGVARRLLKKFGR